MKMYNKDTCIFCKDLSKRIISYWIDTNKGTIVDKTIDDSHVVLYESENFCVIPDIAPLTLGHVLIVSKAHIRSLTHFSNSLALELRQVVSYIDLILSNGNPNNVIHFEHGAGDDTNQSLRSVDHFHLHCVPLNIDLDVLMAYYSNCFYKSINDYTDIAGEKILDYILCESRGKISIYLINKSNIKSQLLRQLIFNYTLQNNVKYSLDDYNWKRSFRKDYYQESKEFLNDVFREAGK